MASIWSRSLLYALMMSGSAAQANSMAADANAVAPPVEERSAAEPVPAAPAKAS